MNWNYNDLGSGNCVGSVYDPPHCVGYNNGEVHEGFEILCRRGSDGAVVFVYLKLFIIGITAPGTVNVSLWMICRAVKQQEQVNAGYEAICVHSQHCPSDSIWCKQP